MNGQCTDSLIKNPFIKHVECFGDSNAYFFIQLTDKVVQPVKYAFKKVGVDTILSTKDYIYNLKTGIYSCTVTDARGCQDSVKVEITQPKQLSVDLQTVQCDDGSGNGKMKAIVREGDASYPYHWANGDTILSQVKAGVGIWVKVKNGEKCEFRDRELMIKCGQTTCNRLIIKDLVIQEARCYGSLDGTAYAVLKDSISKPVTTELYDNAYRLIHRDVYSLVSGGNYTYISRDANGCVDSIKFEVKQPQPIKIEMIIVNCDDGSGNGAIKAKVQSRDSSYLYTWATGDTILRNLKAGKNYDATVLDGICFFRNQITMILCNTTKTNDISESIRIYPNPVSDKITIETTSTIQKVEILDVLGKSITVYTQKDLKELPISILHAGSYFIRIYTEKGIVMKKFIKL